MALSKDYSDYSKAESAYDMIQEATLKDVFGGYMICAVNGQRLLSDAALADKADLILMVPVESLQVMVLHHFHMPMLDCLVQTGNPTRVRRTSKTNSTTEWVIEEVHLVTHGGPFPV